MVQIGKMNPKLKLYIFYGKTVCKTAYLFSVYIIYYEFIYPNLVSKKSQIFC